MSENSFHVKIRNVTEIISQYRSVGSAARASALKLQKKRKPSTLWTISHTVRFSIMHHGRIERRKPLFLVSIWYNCTIIFFFFKPVLAVYLSSLFFCSFYSALLALLKNWCSGARISIVLFESLTQLLDCVNKEPTHPKRHKRW